MDKLKALQIKKLLKELDFIETDLEYTTEAVIDADSSFMNSINDFLERNPDIKEAYDKKITESINKSIKERVDKTEQNLVDSDNLDNNDVDPADETIDEELNSDTSKNLESEKIKKLYREIVKNTHPDKIIDSKLNDIYIKATELYNNGNKIGIYRICSELGISYELEDGDEGAISNKISDIRKKIEFLESTFAWKWSQTNSQEERENILMIFVKLKIGI